MVFDSLDSIEINPKSIEFRSVLYECEDRLHHYITSEFNLKKLTGPILLDASDTLNDMLNGVNQGPIEFKSNGRQYQIAQSLAKYKRWILNEERKRNPETTVKGIAFRMNALRPTEIEDYKHTISVRQIDWEMYVDESNYHLDFFYGIIRRMWSSIVKLNTEVLQNKFVTLHPEVFFITTEELAKLYPELSDEEREDAIVREHKVVFVSRIKKERSFEYDNRKKNGDLLILHRGNALEIFSGGLRVNAKRLRIQAEEDNQPLRGPYHESILSGEMCLTLGGGLGIERVLMLLFNAEDIHLVSAPSA